MLLCLSYCGFIYAFHAHIEGELKANRNIDLFCTFALMIVNAKIIYCIYDTTCMIVINKQKGGDWKSNHALTSCFDVDDNIHVGD